MVHFYNQGNGAIGIITKTGMLLESRSSVGADPNHYWAEYITRDGGFTFVLTIVFEEYHIYQQVHDSILAGDMNDILGNPSSIEEGNSGYVHNPDDLIVDWFVIRGEEGDDEEDDLEFLNREIFNM